MDILRTADTVSLNALKTQQGQDTHYKRLSSGLRVTNAADDPSGLAISEQAKALISGFDQGQRNVQDANNALDVAEHALGTVTEIIQRVRSLVIAGNSDIASVSDKQSLQLEINQLLHEINGISDKTQFNGRNLLDGSLAESKPAQPARIVPVTPPADPNTGVVGSPNVADQTGTGVPGPLLSNLRTGYNVPGSYMTATINNYDPIANTIDINTTQYSSDPDFGPAVVATSTIPVGAGPQYGVQLRSGNSTYIAVTLDLANLSPQDVGSAQAFVIFPSTAPVTGQPLAINAGPNEGSLTQIAIKAANTGTLGISNISVLPPAVTDAPGNPSTISSSSNLSATGALYSLDNALETVGEERAEIGAQLASLHSAGQADVNASTALTAAESQIRDANIGQETTATTKGTILTQVQTKLLQQVQASALQNDVAIVDGSRLNHVI